MAKSILGAPDHWPWMYEPSTDFLDAKGAGKAWGCNIEQVDSIEKTDRMIEHLRMKEIFDERALGAFVRAAEYWASQPNRRARRDWTQGFGVGSYWDEDGAG